MFDRVQGLADGPHQIESEKVSVLFPHIVTEDQICDTAVEPGSSAVL